MSAECLSTATSCSAILILDGNVMFQFLMDFIVHSVGCAGYKEGHMERRRYVNGTMYSVNLPNLALDNSIFASLASVK